MSNWIRAIIRVAFLIAGLVTIYLLLSNVIRQTNDSVQEARNGNMSATVVNSYVSDVPFGPAVSLVKRNSQIFYNMQIERTEGDLCYVRTSWRWVLRLKSGNTVMWNKSDGEFYSGDRTENLAQAVQVPDFLLPGDYTLSRLASFKCGNVDDYAKSVRNIDLRVE